MIHRSFIPLLVAKSGPKGANLKSRRIPLKLLIAYTTGILAACGGGDGGCYTGIETECGTSGDVGTDEINEMRGTDEPDLQEDAYDPEEDRIENIAEDQGW